MLAAGLVFHAAGLSADIHYAGGYDLGVYPYGDPETAAFYLQDAVDAAEPGDTVVALPRLYPTAEAGLAMGPGVALRGSGPEQTVILGNVRAADGVHISGFTFVDSGLHAWNSPPTGPLRWSVSDCVLDGSVIECIPGPWEDELIVRRCVFKNLWQDTAIRAYTYKVTIGDCRFEMTPGARAWGINAADTLEVSNCLFSGCEIAVYCLQGKVTITNCLFSANSRALHVVVADTLIKNSTFFRNDCSLSTDTQCERGPQLKDCIVWASGSNNFIIERSDGFGVPQVSFSDVEGGYPGQGNIDADPMFFLPSAEQPDLHLCAFSPCIDAGDPFSDYSNEPDPNGGRINMGAYDGTWEATTSELVDRDGDHLRDDWEIEHFGSLDRGGTGDADGDGLPEREEYRRLTNPNNPDTDNDGLLDGEEVFDLNTSPLTADTDNDGTPDAKEVAQGTDPLDWTDAFTVLDFYIEEGYLYITYPTNPGYEYSLYSSNWPNGPFGFTLPSYQGRYGENTHTDILRLGPYNRFFRIRAWQFPGP